MTVINHDTGEIVDTIGADAARRLTTEARSEFKSAADHFEQGWAKVEAAVVGGGHLDLGYRSPGEYLHAEFDGVLSGLDVASRRIAVKTMTSWGLSTRAIAAPLGVSDITVRRDQAPATYVAPQTPEPAAGGEAVTGSGASPEGGSFPDVPTSPASDEGEPHATPARPPVTGIDGKTYPRPEPAAPRTPPRRALADQFFDAAFDLTKAVDRIVRLTNDDRFPQNTEKVAAKNRDDLQRARDVLDDVLARMP